MTEHKTDMNITKIEKYKKLNMTEHKTDMNITKIEKYKKLNMAEHKTDMSITKIDKYKNKPHFYDGAQNRHEHITINIYKSMFIFNQHFLYL